MKFKILSHAGISITEKNKTLIIDPWLIGSCYWRSWWNYPELTNEEYDSISADYLYLTHLHWDHFHGASLKLFFDKNIQIYVPKVQTKRMVEDLKYLGFDNVIEIPHNKKIKICDKFSLHSFQFGPGVDSGIMVSTEQYNLFDANDCKLFGYTFNNIKKQYKNIDFVLRSHSSATPIPQCIEGYKEDFIDFRTMENYAEEFSKFCISINARYAIPFASNHCYLHKETEVFNKNVVRPYTIEPIFNTIKNDLASRTELTIMSPSSSWDSETGFKIRDFDYSNSKEDIATLKNKYKVKLEKQYEKENIVVADYKSFNQYFLKLIKSIPYFYRQTFKKKIIFKIDDAESTKYWALDLKNFIISEFHAEPENSIIIETPPIVINDCTSLNMFSVWTASKRLKIKLSDKEDLKFVNNFFIILDLYELNRLPLKNNLTHRSIINLLRRWREVLTGIGFIIKYKLLKKEFIISDLYN